MLLIGNINISISSDGLPAMRRPGFNPQVGKIPWRRKWQSTPVLLPEKFHGWRSLVGYSSWDRKQVDTTQQLHLLISCESESVSLSQLCLTLCNLRTVTLCNRLLCPWTSPGKNTGVGCHFLLQGILLTQVSNLHPLCLLHWPVDSLFLAPLGKPLG